MSERHHRPDWVLDTIIVINSIKAKSHSRKSPNMLDSLIESRGYLLITKAIEGEYRKKLGGNPLFEDAWDEMVDNNKLKHIKPLRLSGSEREVLLNPHRGNVGHQEDLKFIPAAASEGCNSKRIVSNEDHLCNRKTVEFVRSTYSIRILEAKPALAELLAEG